MAEYKSLSKQELKDKLIRGEVLVTFLKTNGDLREMKCTLHQSYLPQPEILQEFATFGIPEKNDLDTSPNLLAVWDIDNNGWRSFRVDSVKKVVA